MGEGSARLRRKGEKKGEKWRENGSRVVLTLRLFLNLALVFFERSDVRWGGKREKRGGKKKKKKKSSLVWTLPVIRATGLQGERDK